MAFSAHTSEAFAKHIEHCVAAYKMSYMDAVIDFCTKRELEPEDVLPLLSDKIKTAIAAEGQALHFLKKQRALED